MPQPTKKQPRPTGKKTNPQTIAALTRDTEAMRLRTEDHTYQQIADELGYDSRSSAFNAVKRHMDAIEEEAVENLRTVEDAKLARGFQEVFRILNTQVDLERIPEEFSETAKVEMIVSKLADHAELKLKAIDRLDKLSGRRARLLGLEAPQKTELTGADGFPISINPEMLPAAAVEALRNGQAAQGES